MRRKVWWWFGLGGLACLAAGCGSVPLADQDLVGRPEMAFSDSYVFQYEARLLGQIEPGSALSGGAQSAGCTACQ